MSGEDHTRGTTHPLQPLPQLASLRPRLLRRMLLGLQGGLVLLHSTRVRVVQRGQVGSVLRAQA